MPRSRSKPRLVHVARHRVDDLHGMAVVSEPCGVYTGASADIEDLERRSWKVPPDDLLGAHQLEAPGATGEPVSLDDLRFVVTADLRCRLDHDPHVETWCP